MQRVLNAIKATYNFFSGDAILLSAAIIAFALGLLLAKATAPNALVAVIFVAIIVAGLVITLGREIAGRPRQR